VKMFNSGEKTTMCRVSGFLHTKIASYLMNLHLVPRPVYITRHGESLFNKRKLIGGDSGLSARGKRYAKVLARFVAGEGSGSGELQVERLNVWCSTMKRTRDTARHIRCAAYVEWRALREIEAGVCDGMTYAQIEGKYPEDFAARAEDKLRYRYPRGESYLDIIARLEPVIFEIERQRAPVIVIAHQAVLRCLYAYFLDTELVDVPYLKVPLHTVIRLSPKAYGCEETRFALMPTDDEKKEAAAAGDDAASSSSSKGTGDDDDDESAVEWGVKKGWRNRPRAPTFE